MTTRVRLGELLVEAQIITREQLGEVLAAQQRDGRRLGVLLVESGLVSETQVTQILSQQLSVPWVSLYHIDFSRQLLNLVPHELAERFCLVPIFVRRVRSLGETLYVAMDDPSDELGLSAVNQYAGLPVRAMIAPPSDIRSAIRVYYGGVARSSSLSEAVAEAAQEDAARTGPDRMIADDESIEELDEDSVRPIDSLPPPAPTLDEPPATPVTIPDHLPAQRALDERTILGDAAPTAAATPAAATPAAANPAAAAPGAAPAADAPAADAPPDSAPPDSAPMAAREAALPQPKRGKKARMITLTLLDGTQMVLPARPRAQTVERPAVSAGDLTAGDMIAALRALSHGTDASEVLGDNVRWEAFFAALLQLLLKKHLIADWEFVEEYKKLSGEH